MKVDVLFVSVAKKISQSNQYSTKPRPTYISYVLEIFWEYNRVLFSQFLYKDRAVYSGASSSRRGLPVADLGRGANSFPYKPGTPRSFNVRTV